MDNPSANDTLEGITEWWLLEQRVKTGLNAVQSALNHLEILAFVVVKTRLGGTLSYSVNKERVSAIKKWLDSESSTSPDQGR